MSILENSLMTELLGIGLAAALSALGYWLLDRLFYVLPLNQEQRQRLNRLKPLVGLCLVVVLGLYAARALFSSSPAALPIAMLLVGVALFLAARNVARDFIAGVAIRSEQSCRTGDQVRILDMRGTVVELGARNIVLETPEGDTALIPYSRAASVPIVRTKANNQEAAHTFLLRIPAGVSFLELASSLERTGLNHHWSSIARAPLITKLASDEVEVTVFALAPEHAADIETALRRSSEALGSAS